MSLSYCPRCRKPFDRPDQEVCDQCGYQVSVSSPPPVVTVVKIPLGLTLLALLYGVLGGLPMLGGLVLLFIPQLATGFTDPPLFYRLAALAGIASGLACFAFALGIWNLKPWAPTLGMAVIVVGVISNVASGTAGWLSFVIAGAMIWYLRRPDVQALFETDHVTPSLLGPIVTKVPPRPKTHLGAGIAILAIYVAGLAGLAAWAYSDNLPKPLQPAPPGTIGDLCFSDQMLRCDLSATRPLDSSHLTFHYTGDLSTRHDLVISRIEGDQERRVFVQDMNDSRIWGFSGTRGLGMYGPFSCEPCSESATYVGRAMEGSTVIEVGYFRT